MDDLARRTGTRTAIVASSERPVPLHFSYVTTPIHETLEELLTTHQAPVYVVHFTQAEAIERAQALSSLKVATREERDQIAALIGEFRFAAGFGRTLSRLIRMGIGVHHAGMLPRYRRLVETLAQAGLLKVICGTDTLGVGINVPIRTVVLTGLAKYDGVRTRHLRAREFHQIAGRAGRAGYDTVGSVVVQAPSTRLRTPAWSARPATTRRSFGGCSARSHPRASSAGARRRSTELVAADPEPLTSSFAVTHSMLLNVIARPGDPFAAMRTPADRQPRRPGRPTHATSGTRSRSAAPFRWRRRRTARPSPSRTAAVSASPSTCRPTSPSTSPCPPSRWHRSRCSTRTRRPTPSTSCR